MADITAADRRDIAILDRLSRVFTMGHAEICETELLHLADRSNFSIHVWTLLREKWTQTLVESGYKPDDLKHYPLLIGYWDGTYTLVWGACLQYKAPAEDSDIDFWLKPLDLWIDEHGRKTQKRRKAA